MNLQISFFYFGKDCKSRFLGFSSRLELIPIVPLQASFLKFRNVLEGVGQCNLSNAHNGNEVVIKPSCIKHLIFNYAHKR